MGYSDAGRTSLRNNKRIKKKFFGSFKNILWKHNLKKTKNSTIKKMDDFEMLKLKLKLQRDYNNQMVFLVLGILLIAALVV